MLQSDRRPSIWRLFLRRWHIANPTPVTPIADHALPAQAYSYPRRISPPAISARQFAIEAARMLADTRCHNVVILDVTGVSPVTDFMVVATGTSPRQMRSACEDVEEFGEPNGHRPLGRSDDGPGNWILMDFVDVVIHVFTPEARMFYDLDNLWGDARRVAWEREGAAGTASAAPAP